MALVSKNIPNLINGVSQQPAALRLESQGEVQENGFSDVVDGLKKRPPTKFLKALVRTSGQWGQAGQEENFNLSDSTTTVQTANVLDNAFYHTYKRSDDEQYLVVITIPPILYAETTATIFVYDIHGNLRYESGAGSWLADGTFISGSENTDDTSYLAHVPKNLKATSVADSTFIVNTAQVVEQDASRGELYAHPREALIYLKSTNYGRQYRVKVDGPSNRYATKAYNTPKSITTISGSNNDTQTDNNDALKTGTVINALRDITQETATITSGAPSAALTRRPASHSQEPYFIVRANEEFGDFGIKVMDDDGGVNLKAFQGTAKSFTDLPNQCEHGFILGVVGDNNKKEDDFYVQFNGYGGSGYWKECVAPNINNGFKLSTMPHQLKQKADLSFTFSEGDWHNRVCGDDNTNPFPSFCNEEEGRTISDIFFHRNRLGILSGENVIFSEASGYYNFFRTTVRTLLDSDPIDVAVSQNEVSELKAAVPIQDNLLLFSELNQFTLSATQLLTPAEVTIDQSTKYECNLTSTPVGAGTSVFFATQSGNFSGVREFFTKNDTEIKDAPEITSHVPKYIKGTITEIAVSSNEDMLVALTDDNHKECYVYKWYNSATERLQSSWSKWIFKKDITSVAFNNAQLYITFNDGSYEYMDLAQLDNPVFLDSQFNTADADNVPDDFLTPTMVAITEEGYNIGTYVLDNLSQPIVEYLATGKHLTIGEPYTFKYQMSEQVFKPVQGDSTKLARFQLRKMSFNFSNTGKFDVTVDSIGRDPSVATFSGRILGEPENILGQAAVVPEGSFSVGVQSKPATTKITITNDTHLPSVFQSAEWEGFVVLRNQRL